MSICTWTKVQSVCNLPPLRATHTEKQMETVRYSEISFQKENGCRMVLHPLSRCVTIVEVSWPSVNTWDFLMLGFNISNQELNGIIIS